MSAPDYGEPWQPFDDHGLSQIDDRDTRTVVSEGFQSSELRDRAIACVNACAGIADPERVVPLLVEVALSMLKYAKDKTFYPLREECRFVEHLTKLSAAIAALEAEREGDE